MDERRQAELTTLCGYLEKVVAFRYKRREFCPHAAPPRMPATARRDTVALPNLFGTKNIKVSHGHEFGVID